MGNVKAEDSNKFVVTFFDVNGGDAIRIRFLGNDSKWHNILIDGGFGNTYRSVFGPLIHEILQKEVIDLWIITHPDQDHIGGILGFINDNKIKNKKNVLKEVWFNFSPNPIINLSDKLSVNQGVSLRNYLEDNGFLLKSPIDNSLAAHEFYGLTIRVLSPSPEKLRESNEKWKKKETDGKLGRKVEQSDHSKSIEDLEQVPFIEDGDSWNGGAIALLIEFQGVKCILLSDSHPGVVEAKLDDLGYDGQSRISIDFLQLSHHGSKANNSPSLLKKICTTSFVVTGNGITNRHPDKATLVRILFNSQKGNEIEFHFPSDTTELRELFSVDNNPYENWRFKCLFPSQNKKKLEMVYLPKI